jgi:hypothetical protein
MQRRVDRDSGGRLTAQKTEHPAAGFRDGAFGEAVSVFGRTKRQNPKPTPSIKSLE